MSLGSGEADARALRLTSAVRGRVAALAARGFSEPEENCEVAMRPPRDKKIGHRIGNSSNLRPLAASVRPLIITAVARCVGGHTLRGQARACSGTRRQ